MYTHAQTQCVQKDSLGHPLVETDMENGQSVRFYRYSEVEKGSLPDPVNVKYHIRNRKREFIYDSVVQIADEELTTDNTYGWVVYTPGQIKYSNGECTLKTDTRDAKDMVNANNVGSGLVKVGDEHKMEYRINTYLSVETGQGIGILVTSPCFVNSAEEPLQAKTELVDTASVPQCIKPKIEVLPNNITTQTNVIPYGYPIAQLIPVNLTPPPAEDR